jgi:hypothetical protein
VSRRSSSTDIFFDLINQHAADKLILHNNKSIYEICLMREGVLNVHKSHPQARDNPRAIH